MDPTLSSQWETTQISLHKTNLPAFCLVGNAPDRISCYMCKKAIAMQYGTYYKDKSIVVEI